MIRQAEKFRPQRKAYHLKQHHASKRIGDDSQYRKPSFLMSFALQHSNVPSSERPYLSLLLGFDDIVTDIDIPRYLRKNDATLKFPVKVRIAEHAHSFAVLVAVITIHFEITQLLLLIEHAKREATDCLAWTPDGKGVILRTTSPELPNKILPYASCGGKLLSFTRKLYRWGFRQARSSYDKEKIFCHPFFQRDDKTLIVGMKSTTAEGTKRALAAKSLMAFQESSSPKQLQEICPPTTAKMDHNLPVHNRFRCSGTNLAMPITTHSIPREAMFIPGAMCPPLAGFGMGYGHPSFHLSPPAAGVHHLVSSTIHGAMSQLDAGKLHPSMAGYFQPPPSMQSLNTMPLLQPHRFNRPTFLGGNTHGPYEAADKDFPIPSEEKTTAPSFAKRKVVKRVKT
jgi:hypothetical protein